MKKLSTGDVALICAIVLALYLGLTACGPQITQEMMKANAEYIQGVNDLRGMALQSQAIAGFEVAVIKALLGERLKLLPHESYLNLERAAAISLKQGELTEEDLGFLAVWKITVLTPIALEILRRHAPDILNALGLLL